MKYFTKQAKLDVSRIEDEIGTFFPDSMENQARAAIQEKIRNSFILRHPIATGIPTLGIAPAIAQQSALNGIVRDLVRKNVNLRTMYEQTMRERRQNELERYKADSTNRAAETVGRYGVLAAERFGQNNQK